MNHPLDTQGPKLGLALSTKPRGRAVLITALVISTSFAALVSLIVPQFDSVLTAIGFEQLPLLTRWFVKGHLAMWILPIGVLASWFVWPNPSQRSLLAICFGIVAPMGILPFAIIALYLPIFQIASTV